VIDRRSSLLLDNSLMLPGHFPDNELPDRMGELRKLSEL
jgi:hypothetical protein